MQKKFQGQVESIERRFRAIAPQIKATKQETERFLGEDEGRAQTAIQTIADRVSGLLMSFEKGEKMAAMLKGLRGELVAARGRVEEAKALFAETAELMEAGR